MLDEIRKRWESWKERGTNAIEPEQARKDVEWLMGELAEKGEDLRHLIAETPIGIDPVDYAADVVEVDFDHHEAEDATPLAKPKGRSKR